MALTPLRWIVSAIAGCVLVFYLLVQRQPRERTYRQREDGADSARRVISGALNREVRRLWNLSGPYRIASLLDSTGQVASATPEGDFRIFVDSALPREAKAAFAVLAKNSMSRQTGQSRVGIDVHFVFDTAHSIRGVMRGAGYGTSASYRLPLAAGERCRILVRIGQYPSIRAEVNSTLRAQATVDQLLGPCAYYRAFGMPGPRISEWLVKGGWYKAVNTSWNRSPPKFDPGVGQRSRYFAAPSPVLGFLSSGGLACSTGVAASCVQMISIAADQPLLSDDKAIVTRSTRLGPRVSGSLRFGTREPELLAGMVRSLGRNRFEKVWTSPDSLDVAFSRVSGRPLGQWLSGWMVDQYGTLTSGPLVGLLTTALSLLVVFAGVGLSMAATARRRAT